MNVEPKGCGLAELALRASLGQGNGAWLAILVPGPEPPDEVTSELEKAIVVAVDGAVQVLRRPRTPEEIVTRAEAAPGDVLVVGGLEAFGDSQWKTLDLARSRLQRSGSVVLVLTMGAAASVERSAPHLASWLGGSIWTWDPHAEELSDEERARRIAALEDWSGKTSQEVVGLAERRELPPDPEYREWLLLVGRGDLVAA